MEKSRSHLTKLYLGQMNFPKPSVVSLLSVSCFYRARLALALSCHCAVRGHREEIRYKWIEHIFHGSQQAWRPFIRPARPVKCFCKIDLHVENALTETTQNLKSSLVGPGYIHRMVHDTVAVVFGLIRAILFILGLSFCRKRWFHHDLA